LNNLLDFLFFLLSRQSIFSICREKRPVNNDEPARVSLTITSGREENRPGLPVFSPIPEKRNPHIRVSTGFLGARWGKAGVGIIRDSMANKGHYLTSESGEFRQTERLYGVFSTRTENLRFTGVLGRCQNRKEGIGALFGPGLMEV